MPELSKAIARLMEERERVQPQAAVVDVPKLREVLDAVRSNVTPGERPLADALVRLLLDKAGADLLQQVSVSELAGMATAMFRCLQDRRPEEPRVTVFDPDLIDGGWDAHCTVVQTLMRDRPFIVDTIRECLRQAGCTVLRLVHPILAVERDGRRAVLAIGPPSGLGLKESLVHVEVERVLDREGLAKLLRERLADVVLATDDYQAMRFKAEQIADELRERTLQPPWNADIDEIAAFIDWLGQKNFVFLGYREYQFAGRATERTAAVRAHSGLGILRREDRSTFATPQALPDDLRRRLSEPPLMIVSKTNAESPIHRRAHMDYIGIKEVDNSGIVIGERRFIGLFTSKAYAEDPGAVPLVRRKLTALVDAEGAAEDTHDYKAIVTVFDSLPEIERLATPVAALRAEIRAILAAEGGSDVKVLQRPDALGRGAFVVVIVPRERFSNELHRSVEARLGQALSATAVLDRRLVIDDSDQVRMHFYLGAPAGGMPDVQTEELRAHVTTLLRTWDDRLREELLAHFPRDEARVLAERYTTALSNQYKAATDVGMALRDIRCLEALRTARTAQVDLNNPPSPGDTRFTAVKLYLAEERLVLSDFLPVLENLGLKVFTEEPLDVSLPGVGQVHMRTFLVQDGTGAALNVDAVAPLLVPALLMLHGGRVESDRLNALILHAGLDWRQVDLLRTYVNHGVQIGSAPSRDGLVSALVNNPHPARVLWQYFEAKFDPLIPDAPRDRLAHRLAEIEQLFIASLDAVQSVVEDRILRALFGAVVATVRTNYFQPQASNAAGGQAESGALAVKFESARLAHLPRPHPEFEIYVHAPLAEGLHLRGAKVARGGIRLSDRPDDFRTEILDLMKTQMVKNAVIVPAGAKGGFIVKRRFGAPPPSGQIVAAYRTFIGALLDLTDNVVQGRLAPPPDLLPYDEPDPYLVVAADKGTASFSDIANAVAVQRQFWLGDAFASGGTHGYDHKKEAITARGAWECVRRHFREMGRDVDREMITVVGIGDMSGDVFGNGMLLSRRLCLRAAFNHQHIFLDPNPDPARSFAERERLFVLPRSTWAEYNSAFLSEGGGVYPRQAKRVALSEPARSMLGLGPETPTGEEVVRAILRMEADLLWNGGIGTYVKAAEETAADVGDSANDAVRINGAEVRATVVAEGGNLGFTQRGRVEYALRGGCINTDAIDNSAGVDMSDHEVNLKIGLAAAVEAGQLTFDDRNQLLTELTPDVSRRVLAHNHRQARIISVDQLRSQMRLSEFRDLMLQLESDGGLDRRLEGLPDRDTLRNRRGVFLGLTRPELAVLLAHSKLALQQRVIASDLPDDAFFEQYLRGYFPDVIDARFGLTVRSHRLRREIISVEVANALIDSMGAAFATRICRDTGADPVAVVRAWAVVVHVSGAVDLAAEIGGADPPLPWPGEASCWFALEGAVERAVKWVVETQPAFGPAEDLASTLAEPAQLLDSLPALLPSSAQQVLATAVEALAAEGTPRTLAQRIVALDRLAELFEISRIAADVALPRDMAADAYYRVGDIVNLDWVRQQLAELPRDDRWERRAIEGVNATLGFARRQMTRDILLSRGGGGDVDACFHDYVDAHREPLAHLAALINDVKSARHATLAALMVVVRELSQLVGLVV